MKGSRILQLLTGKDQVQVVGRSALHVLNFLLEGHNGVRMFHMQRDSLASQSSAQEEQTMSFSQPTFPVMCIP